MSSSVRPRVLAGALLGAVTGGVTIETAVRASGVAFADELSVLVSFAGGAAVLGAALASGRARAERSRRRRLSLLGASFAAVAAGALAFAALVRAFSGHWPWDLRWPAATLVMARGWPSLVRHLLAAALALTASQLSTLNRGPRLVSTPLVGALVAALFLAIPVSINGEMSWVVWGWLAFAAGFAALSSAVLVRVAPVDGRILVEVTA